MEYPDAETMARALVREHSSIYYVQTLVKEVFSDPPSLRKIEKMRSEYVKTDPEFRRSSHNARAIPDDFKQTAPLMNKNQLARHYKVKWSGTIDRWLKEAGVEARVYIPPAKRLSMMGQPRKNDMVPERIKDYDEIAADILRRERFLVNRCNEDGRFNLTGKFWRVGMNIYSKEALIEKAEKYGAV